jgi:hypothetical protein
MGHFITFHRNHAGKSPPREAVEPASLFPCRQQCCELIARDVIMSSAGMLAFGYEKVDCKYLQNARVAGGQRHS